MDTKIIIIVVVVCVVLSSSSGVGAFLLMKGPKDSSSQSQNTQNTQNTWKFLEGKNLNDKDCWKYGRYWFGAGKPPYCDIWKNVRGKPIHDVCNINPDSRKSAPVDFKPTTAKSAENNDRDHATRCANASYCFDSTQASNVPKCYLPSAKY